MKLKTRILSLKNFINDSLWSIAGLLLMNIIAQFAVYPIWSRVLGSEGYGNILFLISIINIIAVSCGGALNLSRMVASTNSKTVNGNYNIILLTVCTLCIPVSILIPLISDISMKPFEIILYWLLMCLTVWRYYADVDYRLSTNYKGYFFYYICICIGYALGIPLFYITGFWQSALIPGEFCGLLLVIVRGSTIRQKFLKYDSNLQTCLKSFLYLISAQFLSNLIFNSDRLVLKIFVSASAVSIYYIASLFGKTISLLTMPLNSVIIGHLAKYKGSFHKKLIRNLLFLLLGVIILVCLGCTIASYIILGFLYPNDFNIASKYFFVANLGQIFYFVSGIFTTIILRFAEEKCQLYINILYGVTFLIFVIPMTYFGDLWSFSLAILITNTLRFFYAAGFAFYYSDKNKINGG